MLTTLLLVGANILVWGKLFSLCALTFAILWGSEQFAQFLKPYFGLRS